MAPMRGLMSLQVRNRRHDLHLEATDRANTPVAAMKAAEDWAMGLELLVSEEFNSGDY